jgi:hypothetical protein
VAVVAKFMPVEELVTVEEGNRRILESYRYIRNADPVTREQMRAAARQIRKNRGWPPHGPIPARIYY